MANARWARPAGDDQGGRPQELIGRQGRGDFDAEKLAAMKSSAVTELPLGLQAECSTYASCCP